MLGSMRVCWVVALLLSGVSGETEGCVADAESGIPLGDVTSLLQRRDVALSEHQDEVGKLLLMQSGTITRRCLHDGAALPPLDCVLGEWSAWSACDKPCGSGTRKRTREVQAPAHEGGKCGCLAEAETCNVEPCRDDVCKMDVWSDWTECSKSCGSGTRSRSRKVLSVKKQVGKCPCTQAAETCNTDPCQPDPTQAPMSLVCAKVKDVSNQDTKLEGATVTILSGSSGSQVTGPDGEFCFNLPPGSVTLRAEHKDYVTEEVSRVVVAGKSSIKDIEMSSLLGEQQWRIVMKWSDQPKDLDSWTEFGKAKTLGEKTTFEAWAKADSCTMNWWWKESIQQGAPENATCKNNGVVAHLDQDNRDIKENDQAETTTLYGVDGSTCGDDCKINFCVYQYDHPDMTNKKPAPPANGENLKSQATVEVYNGIGGKSKKVKTFEIEKQGQGHGVVDGRSWFVFTIDAKTKKVIPCSDLESECAKMPCGAYNSR